ncbi:DUF3883 domain-containing protein [Candidatus Marinimicrobia bacterium PRS2]|nr:DUF3883 domain-containing protein [Candidatus Marinimicrobia bacterium PRS2]
MKNYKEQFQFWLIEKYGDTGTPGSYIKAVDILDQKLGIKIFALVDTKYLKSLYLDLIKKQSDPNYKYFDSKRPSYGSKGFYSASIKAYIEFLDEFDIGENLLSYIISAIHNAGGQATLKYIYESVSVLSRLNGIDYSEYYKNEESYTGQIRKTIYLHSSDCDIYTSNNPDLFMAPEEKGRGLWALRDTNSEEEIPKETEKEVTIRKNAAITGKEAEDEFDNWANNQGWEVINTSDSHGLGYDFECVADEGEKIFVEVKGCRGDIDAIRLTEREWEVAEEKGPAYHLMIISNLDDTPKINKFKDPYNLFNDDISDPQITISVSYHLKKRFLVDALEGV